MMKSKTNIKNNIVSCTEINCEASLLKLLLDRCSCGALQDALQQFEHLQVSQLECKKKRKINPNCTCERHPCVTGAVGRLPARSGRSAATRCQCPRRPSSRVCFTRSSPHLRHNGQVRTAHLSLPKVVTKKN